MRLLLKTMMVISLIYFLAWIGVRAIADYNFEANCESHLIKAASTNDIEVAKLELNKSIEYLDNHNLDNGQISIISEAPANNIKLWYDNLNVSLNELSLIQPSSTQLEKLDILSKLRNSLIETNRNVTKVIRPEGIEVYPFNKILCLWGFFSFVLFITFSYLYDYNKRN